MSLLASKIESLLLVSAKPLSFKELAKFLKVEAKAIEQEVANLQERYNQPEQGIHLLVSAGKVQFSTNPEYAKMVREFMHDETSGELTKPSLETLTIIAYRQPISKEELDTLVAVTKWAIESRVSINGGLKTSAT